MHPDNVLYGHRRILLDHMGVEADRPLAAHLQHGWQSGTGLNEARRLVPWFPKLVWSSRNRDACVAEGIGRVTAIGAPFAYLVKGQTRSAAGADGTIFYPFHPWRRAATIGDRGDLVDAIRARERGPVTVCLYHLDHDDEDQRSVYERAGFRVITHGRPDHTSEFLRRQSRALTQHRRVASNAVSTAVFYGGLLGLEAEVYGPSFRLEGGDLDLAEKHRSLFPGLVGGGLDPVSAQRLARTELGVEHLRSPEDLRTLTGMKRPELARRFVHARVLIGHHGRRVRANVIS